MSTELIKYNYEDKFVTLSNELIRAKEKTNLFESKIEVLAIYRLKNEMNIAVKKDATGNDFNVHYVDIKPIEISALQDRNIKSGSLYDDIKEVVDSLSCKRIIVQNRTTKLYAPKNLYYAVEYRDGILHIEFHPESEYLFLELADNYSKLSLPILFSFKHNGGFQLYKLLKSYTYNLPPIDLTKTQDELPFYTVSYTLSELRLSLGYVDLTQDNIEKEAKKKNPDFEKMNNMDNKPKYKKWADFEKRVIAPGIEEINKQSDIYISRMETIKSGRGGRITDIIFCVQHNYDYYKSIQIVEVDDDEDDKDGLKKYKVIKEAMSKTTAPNPEEEEMVNTLYDYFAEINLSKKQCLTLLKDAKYDIDLIYSVYEKAKEHPYIHDLMAWMRAAIKDGGYEEPIPLSHGDAKRGEQIRNVEKSYGVSKKDESFKEKVWDGYKKREDFKLFIDFVGLPENMIEALPVEDRISLFADYLQSNK